MLARAVLFLCSLFAGARIDVHGSKTPYGGACESLCSCEEKEGFLHVNCDERSIHKISQVKVPLDRPFHLNLYKNDLVEILPEELDDFKNAVTLHLGANSIQELEPGVFSALGSLKKLHINSNFLVMLKEDTFQGLVNLEYLQADTNFIRVVEPGAFSKLIRLKVLILNDNSIEFLPSNIFRFVPLTHLDLRGNKLQTLPYVGFLEHIGRIIELLLEDNNWVCDCQILHLKIWIENMRAQSSIGEVVCSSPHHLRGSTLAKVKRDVLCPSHADINLEEPSKSLDMVVTPSTKVLQIPEARDDAKMPTPAHVPPCVAHCSCHNHPSAGFLIHCEDRGIQKISDLGILQQSPSKLVLTGNMIQRLLKYDFVTYDSLELLNLANNQIDYIDNETFLSLSNLKKLYLNGNRIEKITSTMFLGLHNLEYLYLEYNNIKEIEAGSFNPLTNLKLLFLNNNLLHSLPPQIFRNVPLTKLNLRRNLFTHLPVSNVLDQLDFLEQIYLEDNLWDCTCDLISLKQWVEKLRKDTVVGTVLCHSPRKLVGAEVRSLTHDVLCPGIVTLDSSLLGGYGELPTVAPDGGTSGFFRSLTEAVPLSVLILCLLILFLTVIFCSAGIVVFVLHRRRRQSKKKKQAEEQPRESSPIHLHYSMYGQKTTHHMTERHASAVYDEASRSPVVQVCRNPSYCSQHKEYDAEDYEVEKPNNHICHSITDKENGSPLTGSTLKYRSVSEYPADFVVSGDASSLYKNILERERELQQLSITEYLRKNIPQLQSGMDVPVPGHHQELKLMETLVYARPRKVMVEQTKNEYFELKANLHSEPDYLEVLEHQTSFN